MKIHKCFMCNYLLEIVKRKRKKKKCARSRNTLVHKETGGETDALKGTHSNSTNRNRTSSLENDPEEEVLPALGKVQSEEDIGATADTTVVERNANGSYHSICLSICNFSSYHNGYINERCGNNSLEEAADANCCIERKPHKVNHHIEQNNQHRKEEARYSCMLLPVCEQNGKYAPCRRTLIRRKGINANYSLDRLYLTLVAQHRIGQIKKDIMRFICFVRFFLSQRKNQRAINLVQHIAKWRSESREVTPLWSQLHHLYRRQMSKINRSKCIYSDPILETRKRRSRRLFYKLFKRSLRVVHMLEMEKIRHKRFGDQTNMGPYHHADITRIMKNRITKNRYLKSIIELCQRYVNIVDSSLLCIMSRMGKAVVRIGMAEKKCHRGTIITTDAPLQRRVNLKNDYTNETVGNLNRRRQSFKGRHKGRHSDKATLSFFKENNVGTHFCQESRENPSSIGTIKGGQKRNTTLNWKISNDTSTGRNRRGGNPQNSSMDTPDGTKEVAKRDKIYSTVELGYSLGSRRMSRAKRAGNWSSRFLTSRGKTLVKKMHSRTYGPIGRKKKISVKEAHNRNNNYKTFNLRKNRNHPGRATKMWQSYFREDIKSEEIERANKVEGETTLPEYDSYEEYVYADKPFETNSDNLVRDKERRKEGSHEIYGDGRKDPFWMIDKSGTHKRRYDTPRESEKKRDHTDNKLIYRSSYKDGINQNDLNCVFPSGNRFVECLRSCEHIKNNFKMVKLIKDNCSNFVYKCFDTNNKRYVAIKSVNKEKQLSIMSYSTYLSIYKIVQKINNDNVVKIYDVLESPSHFFIVMELCEGTDLVEYVSKEEIAFEKAKDIICQLLNGINALHANSIIHRDIKLDNLMFKDKGCEKLVIIDFDMSVYMYGELDVPVWGDSCLYGSDTKEGFDENYFGNCGRRGEAAKVNVTKMDCPKGDYARADSTNRSLTNPSFAQNSVHANSVQVNKSLPKHSCNCEYIMSEDVTKKESNVLRRSQFLTNNFDSNNIYANKVIGNNEDQKNCVMYPSYSDSYIKIHKNNKKTTSLNYNYISQIENGFLSACTGNTEKTFINEGDRVIYNDLIIGTKEYMSPYCLKGIYSIKTDIYSIGVTIFLILFKNFPYLFEEKSINKWQNEVINKNKDIVIPFSFLFHNITCTYFVKLMDVHLMHNNIYFCKNSCLLDNNLKEIEKLRNIRIDFNQIKINAKNIYLIEILKRSLSLDLDDQYSSVSEILENKIFV
ncbi:serine/threonine protein kinase [Plasmodium inui San Antonio 1]|uniref:Serine/threonine protein kinase n=1 Tax=Plasmodium inui San Antonio 1 TaxID=1237626 RepID=W7A659_9APIC|nr:serine/threonine protein kinase [Plasmodium inui San Antonio 1]EUD66693.1 serine/threonine protein kinase [Plasmodium inui San Antonio 1]